VGLDELLALHEHAARAAARVVDATPVRREHLDEHADDVRRCVELSALLALGARELREEVLVDPPEHVLRAVGRRAEADVADEVDQLPEPPLVEPDPREVLRQDALQRRVVACQSFCSKPSVAPFDAGRLRGLPIVPFRHVGQEDRQGA
jgi:hypothetical protein